jgi:hypothetical protein
LEQGEACMCKDPEVGKSGAYEGFLEE